MNPPGGKLSATQILAIAGLFAATAAWGSAFVVMKRALDVVPPLYLLAARFTASAALAAPLCAGRLRSLGARDLKAGAALGFWLAAAYIAQTYGLIYTTASNNAFLTALYVVAVPFLGAALNRSRLRAAHLAAAGVAMLGIALLTLGFGPPPSAAGEASQAGVSAASPAYPMLPFGLRLGDALSILCGLLFAVHIILLGRQAKGRDLRVTTMSQFAGAAAICWIAALFAEGAPPIAAFASAESLASLAYLTAVCTVACFLLQAFGQRHLPETTVSIVMAFECAFAAAFAVAMLGDPLTPKTVTGFGAMLGAALISVAGAAKRRTQPNG